MTTKTVAIAGGTGKLGRSIVEELIKQGGYKDFILGREASDERSKELGAQILAVDCTKTGVLVKTLEFNNIDTVISTLGAMSGADPELALVAAADKSSVTKRYIPSLWSIRYTSDHLPHRARQMGYLAALSASHLEYTAITNGFFLDYFGFPHIKSYLGPFLLVLDIAHNVAAIPASGNVPIVFTYTFDHASFVAILLESATWEKESVIIGDKLTWNEFLSIAEEAKGTKFEVSNDSLEVLEKGQVTELPSHKALYSFFSRDMLQSVMATFAVLIERGFMDFDRSGSLNEKFPDIRTMTARELVEGAWREE